MGKADKIIAMLVVICAIAALAASYAGPCLLAIEKLGAAP